MNKPDSAPTIEVVTRMSEELDGFLRHARTSMFGDRVDPAVTPNDLIDFEKTYLSGTGTMLVARLSQSSVVGTIACREYDRRFPQFEYGTQRVVEVVRLFVDPTVRRLGLASRLFDELLLVAKRQRVAVMYLHTHPFLPGAERFWERCGFRCTGVDADPVWQTIHMERLIALDGESRKPA